RFTPQRFTFNLPQNARDGLNITMKLRDPGTPNRATLYFDQLSLKLDPDYIIVIPPKTTPIGAIVGGVVGGIAVLLALVAFVYFFIRRRRRANPPARELGSGAEGRETSVNNLLSNQLLTVPIGHSGEPSIHSAQREPRSPLQHRATSMSGGSEAWNPVLPAYDTSGDQPISPTSDLESFAQYHRNSIDPNLLEKLRRAGYSPLQNPNIYTEEQWAQQFNVT
ncbi:9435_t:CDS:1, partial [Acaulospora colombiana]